MVDATPVPPITNQTDAPPPKRNQAPTGWAPFDRYSIVAIVLTVGTIAGVALPRLPSGVGFGDSGDLQVCSTTLGIMHPPGYACYAAMGYVLTRLPVVIGVDPAYVVSLACLACGLIAIALCVMLQIRLGVHPWLASGMGLLLAAHTRTWTNLVTPEVYAPTLALLFGAAYLLIKFNATGRRQNLYISALLYGCALASRPPMLFALPFFLMAWWMGQRRIAPASRRSIRTLVLLTTLSAIPGIFSLGYVWVLDKPQTPVNYIEMHNAATKALPPVSAGLRGRIERLYHHVSARQFSQYMTQTWHQGRQRLLWLFGEFFGSEYFLFRKMIGALILFLLVFGCVSVYRRNTAALVLLVGLFIANVGFICTYRVSGMAGDMSPLMASGTVVLGVFLSQVWPKRKSLRSRIPIIVFGIPVAVVGLAAAVYALILTADRPLRRPPDATWFVRGVDMASLPRDAVICCEWQHATVLWYAKWVLTDRTDVDIVNTHRHLWIQRIADMGDRLVLATARLPDAPGYRVSPYRSAIHRSQKRTVLWQYDGIDRHERTDAPRQDGG